MGLASPYQVIAWAKKVAAEMSTDEEKFVCMVQAMKTANEKNKELHRQLEEAQGYIEFVDKKLALHSAAAKGLEDSVRGFLALINDSVLVRNTDDDGNIDKFLKQGMRITGHLAATDAALEKYRELVGNE